MRRYRPSDPFCKRSAPAIARRRHNHDKFLAAPTEQHIYRTERFFDHDSELAKHCVPSLMAVGVVDVFEVIDVKEN